MDSLMSKHNGFVLPFVIIYILVSTSQNSLVFGSPPIKTADPLHHFKAYNRGYDVSNKHYWASAAYTGIHGYAIAGLWLLLGLCFGSYITLKNFIGTSSSVMDRPDYSYLIMFSLVALFTIFAIVATALIIDANKNAIDRTRKIKDTIFGAGDDAIQTIQRVAISLRDMQALLSAYDTKTSHVLNLTIHQLGKESRGVQHFVDKGRHIMDEAVESLYIANLGVVTINLVFLVSGLVLLFLYWHPRFIMLRFLLSQLDKQSDDLFGVWEICNPFSAAPSYNYTPENCPKDSIAISDLPNVLSRFTCYKDNSTGNCKGDGRFVPEAVYDMAWAYCQSIQDLINIFPDLQYLTQCSFVKQAISDVASHQCSPFKASVQMLWACMLSLSIVMVTLTLLWVAKAYQDRGRCFSKCSIIPSPA